MLQADSYGGYAALARRSNRVSLAFCWGHVRCRFYELASGSSVSAEILRRIALLYAVEEEVRDASADQRRAGRNERRRVVVEDLHQHLEALSRQVSATSKLREAIRYALSRWRTEGRR